MPHIFEYVNDQTLLRKLMNWDTERTIGLDAKHPLRKHEKALVQQAKLIPEEAGLVDDLMRIKYVIKSSGIEDFMNLKKESEN